MECAEENDQSCAISFWQGYVQNDKYYIIENLNGIDRSSVCEEERTEIQLITQ